MNHLHVFNDYYSTSRLHVLQYRKAGTFASTLHFQDYEVDNIPKSIVNSNESLMLINPPIKKYMTLG